jgi:transitional endoplasmic reticulum ATPase
MTSRLDSLREAVAVSPRNVPLLLLFGQACMDELSFDEARRAFDRVLEDEPAHLGAKLGVAQVLYLSGHTSEAVVRADALTRADPEFADAWMLLSRLAVAEGERDLAAQYYQKAVKLNPALGDPAIEKDIRIEHASPMDDSQPGSGFDEDSEQWELEKEGGTRADLQRPAASFVDVGGMEEIKEEIRMKIIYPLQNRRVTLWSTRLRQNVDQQGDCRGNSSQLHFGGHSPGPRSLRRQQREKSSPGV